MTHIVMNFIIPEHVYTALLTAVRIVGLVGLVAGLVLAMSMCQLKHMLGAALMLTDPQVPDAKRLLLQMRQAFAAQMFALGAAGASGFSAMSGPWLASSQLGCAFQTFGLSASCMLVVVWWLVFPFWLLVSQPALNQHRMMRFLYRDGYTLIHLIGLAGPALFAVLTAYFNLWHHDGLWCAFLDQPPHVQNTVTAAIAVRSLWGTQFALVHVLAVSGLILWIYVVSRFMHIPIRYTPWTVVWLTLALVLVGLYGILLSMTGIVLLAIAPRQPQPASTYMLALLGTNRVFFAAQGIIALLAFGVFRVHGNILCVWRDYWFVYLPQTLALRWNSTVANTASWLSEQYRPEPSF